MDIAMGITVRPRTISLGKYQVGAEGVCAYVLTREALEHHHLTECGAHGELYTHKYSVRQRTSEVLTM